MNTGHEHDIDRRLAREPIAIVGLSALYPKARNLREFWRNIVEAADCIDDVPAGHWRVEDYFDPDPAAPDKTYARRGGFIPTVPFSPMEFGLPPNTLEVTDVLQLLSLMVARDVLNDAGTDSDWYDSSRTGVVLGVTGANQLTQPLSARLQTPVLKEVVRSCGLSEEDATQAAEKFKLAFAPWAENSFPGMLGNVVAGRIANRLNLGAMNATVDAACASSLAATKLAISELIEGRADTMITGGCDAENTIFMYLCFSKTPALSHSGRIRPFDAAADGTLIGEGIGMLALRRLADAKRDANRIYAVIRGIGSSSDGRFKSIYAPRKEGQIMALRRAYLDADCAPASVELVEAHGTGTAVGDATELSALSEVVEAPAGSKPHIAVGSIKSQIGHTKAAAGAAGMIKLALSLHHRLLPPTINVETPAPIVDPVTGSFYVNTRTRPWIRDPNRPQRRAAVSSFGFGGTNFHAILEEHGSGEDIRVTSPAAWICLWHASDPAALETTLVNGAPPATGPVPAGHARVAFAVRGPQQADELRQVAIQQLRARPDAEAWTHPKGVYYRRCAMPGVGTPQAKVGALFAGQGSQYVDLGLTAVLAVPPLRAAFDQANQYLIGTDTLARTAFPAPVFDSAARDAQELALRRTQYAQPAIGALSVGQFRYLSELGFVADGFLGHSFGELTALWAAGSFDDDTFYLLARARGAAMAAQDRPGFDPGAMAAVHASEDQVVALDVLGENLRVCNRNAPDQVVLGGSSEAVDALLDICAQAGLRASRLPVSAAFHTPFVAHALEEFRGHVEGVKIDPPRRPVYANTSGASYGDDLADNRRVLAEQLIHPVHFCDRVEEMYRAGFRVFVEFGPAGVLTRLVGRILGGQDHIAVQLDPGPRRDADVALKQAVAQLAVVGLPVATADRYLEPEPGPAPSRPGTVNLNGINYVSERRRAAYRDAIENGYRVTPPEPVAMPGSPGERSAPSAEPASFPALGPDQCALAVAPDGAGPSNSGAAPVLVGGNGHHPSNGHRPAALTEPMTVDPTTAARTGGSSPASTPTPAVEVDAMRVELGNPAAHHAATAHSAARSDDPLVDLVTDHLALHDEYLRGQLDIAGRLAAVLERAADGGDTTCLPAAVAAAKDHALAMSRTHIRANEVLEGLARLEFGARDSDATVGPESDGPAGAACGTLGVTTSEESLPAAGSAPAAPKAAQESSLGSTQPAPAILPASAVEPEEAVLAGLVAHADQPSNGTDAPAEKDRHAAAPMMGSAVTSGVVAVDVVEQVLLAVVAEKTGYAAEMLELGMDVEADLGIDSIKRVEVMGLMQERFPSASKVEPERLAELRTLGDIASFIAGSIGDNGAPGEASRLADPLAGGGAMPSEGVMVGDHRPDRSDGVAAGQSAHATLTSGVVAVDVVEQVLLAVVAEKTGYAAEMLELGMDVEADLGIDSIKRVEVMGLMQERFPSASKVEPERLAELRTLGDIASFIAGSVGDNGAPGEASQALPQRAADASPETSPATRLPMGIGRAQARLVELPPCDRVVGAYPTNRGALVVDDGSDLVPAVIDALKASGWLVSVIRFPGVGERELGTPSWGPADDDGLGECVDSVLATGQINLCLVVCAGAIGEWGEGIARLRSSLLLARHLVTPLTAAAAEHRATFATVTRLDGGFGLSGVAEEQVPAAGLAGLAKTLAAEVPELYCRAVDLAPTLDPAAGAALLLEELCDLPGEHLQIARDGARRLGLSLGDTAADCIPAGGQVDPPGADDLLVVTGGGRGITAVCAVELAHEYRCGLVLLGRTPVGDEPDWAIGVEGERDLKAAAAEFLTSIGDKPTPRGVEGLYRETIRAREVRSTLAAVRAAGRWAEYLSVDIADPTATEVALAPYRGRVTGVVHGAGVLADSRVARKQASEIERVFRPKLTGLRSVVRALATDRLRHVVLFSSVAGFFGNQGQSDYAMANEVLNAWAASWKRRHPQCRVTAINWGAWESGMVSPQVRELFTKRGISLISPAVGARLFAEQFAAERGSDVVTVLGPTTSLSGDPGRQVPSRVVVERDLAALAGQTLLTDHMIGGVPVLPATMALGWLAGTVERLTGRTVHKLCDFTVQNGVVFDGKLPNDPGRRFELEISRSRETFTAAARSVAAEGTVRPHYSVVVPDGPLTANEVAATDRSDLPAVGTGRDAAYLYDDGTLFHGPTLRGIRRVLLPDRSRLVLECRLPVDSPAGAAYSSRRFSPVTADLLLQACLVWMRLNRDVASLPTGVASVDLYRPIPTDQTFLTVVEPSSVGDSGATLTVTACDTGGQVLAAFTGVTLVSTPQLAARFLQRERP